MLQKCIKVRGSIPLAIERRWSHDTNTRKFLHGRKRDLLVLADDKSHRGVLLPLPSRRCKHPYLLPKPQDNREGMLARCIFCWPCDWRTHSTRTGLQDASAKQRRRQNFKLLHTRRSDLALADGGWHRIGVREASPWRTNKTHRARLQYRYISWRTT